MGNDVEINKQRKTSRIERGLNPDAPKPPPAIKSKAFVIQSHQQIKNKLGIRKRIRKQMKYPRWMNIEFHLNSYAIDMAPA
jgi:hypothetical protein